MLLTYTAQLSYRLDVTISESVQSSYGLLLTPSESAQLSYRLDVTISESVHSRVMVY